MKFIATTSDKINSIEITSGQLIFSRDDRVIYLDSDTGRTSFQQIITLINDQQRLNLTTPLEGFYFVKETCSLWSYMGGVWTCISSEPGTYSYNSKDNFPTSGKKGKIYIDTTKNKMYLWNEIELNYIEANAPNWENIASL